jgi:hypothetical protein
MISKEDVALNKHWIDYEFLLNVKLFEILRNKMGINTRYPMPTDMKEKFFFKISRNNRIMDMTDIGREIILSYCYEEDIDEDEFFANF